MDAIGEGGTSVDEIAPFCNGQGNNAYLRTTQRLDQYPGFHKQVIDHRTADCRSVTRWIQFDYGCQPILLLEFLPHFGVVRPDPGADDTPVVINTLTEQSVQIGGLVGAVEIAHTDVKDAGRDCCAIIMRHPDSCRQQAEGALVQFDRHGQFSQLPPSTLNVCATT